MKGIIIRTKLNRMIDTYYFVFRQKISPFCHIWYNNYDPPVVSPVTEFQSIGPTIGLGKTGLLYPHLLSCRPPETMRHLTPMSVSLVEAECPGSTPSNNLRVFYDKNEGGHKQGIAVCSKGLSYLEDVSMRFIEWIELLRAMEVDKIILKIFTAHPNVLKVRITT